MEHKAYEFDSDNFYNELFPVLEESLSKDENTNLYFFIKENLGYLTDPYEGEPLQEDWEELLETKKSQELGDFALTKYYKVTEDFGLGDIWLPLQEKLPQNIVNALLGTSISGFDPGGYGSYFQSSNQRIENVALLNKSNINQLKNLQII